MDQLAQKNKAKQLWAPRYGVNTTPGARATINLARTAAKHGDPHGRHMGGTAW
jgi:hypothetical protein